MNIFTYFYALPLDKAFTMVFAFSYIIIFINKVLQNEKLKRIVYWAASAIAVFIIIFITVLSRGHKEITDISFVPFSSYIAVINGANPEILRSNLMNVMLFYPLGMFLTLLSSSKKHIALACLFAFFLSAGIECTQLIFSIGYVEMDDLIHNVLGFLLGVGAVKGLNLYFKNF